ncbi:MAG: alpha/beta fold hydrolase [Propionibacteriaceae bacterium]
MKAFIIDSYKSALHEAQVPEPTVGDLDVLVDVRAASVNPLDVKIAEGVFKTSLAYRMPLILGHDLAGVVAAVGSKVTRFAVGDEVYAKAADFHIGTFAERIAVAEADLALKPASLTFEEAASLPLVALTSWQALVVIGNVSPGQRVLIHAGAGGLGSQAIQLAKHLGAFVATTASARNSDELKALGADLVIDYRSQDFSTLLSDYDVVLDSLGGETLDKSLRILKRGGIVVSVSGPVTPKTAATMGLNPILRLAVTALSAKIRRLARKLGVRYEFLFMSANGQQLSDIARLVDAGALRPVVGKVFPFSETPDAMAALIKGGIPGKIVTTRAGSLSEAQPVVTNYAQAPAKTLTVGSDTFAYRELGPAGAVPVIFFGHLAATLDNWDPRIVDAIAQHRHVITFDQLGVGASSGKVPATLEEAAADAYRFITGLGYSTVDVFAFSMGGMVAQDLAVAHPDLVRKLVLTGTGPRGGKDMDKVVGTTYWDVLRATLSGKDSKEFLFFSRNAAGKAAAGAYLDRLKERTFDRDAPIALSSFRTQLNAIARYGRSAPSDLSVIAGPTLIANGDNDRMVPSVLSEDLHRRLANSTLVIYPDSGHGGIFQYHEQFAPLASEFLKES